MKKTYKYRIYGSRKTISNANHWLGLCCNLYNSALAERIYAYKMQGVYLSYYEQKRELPELRKENPEYLLIDAQTLQDVFNRLNKAFQNFFRRVREGNRKAGFPRFKGKGWYDSFTLMQHGWKLCDNELIIKNVGKFKIKISRPIKGNIKTITVCRSSTNKWFVSFYCDNIPEEILPESDEVVGIDMGLSKFAVFSNNDRPIENPRFFITDEKKLVKAQRSMSRCTKGTPERVIAKKVVSHIHERISDRRYNFAHQESRKIINRFGVICIEDLNIRKMLKEHSFAKSISDVAWGQFARNLSYKAENAGRKFVAVDPAYTSQDCSRCGHRQEMPLIERTYDCPQCAISIDRDLNASFNILAIGLDSLGLVPKRLCLTAQ